MEIAGRMTAAIRRVERLSAVRAVRSGLIHMIPILSIGAFALILQTFPIPAYQEFISRLGGGAVLKLLELVYSGTFGVLSVHMTYSISRAYMKQETDPEVVSGGASLSSLLAFFILAGAYLPGFGTDGMGPKSMFLAILTGLGASALYLQVYRLSHKGRRYLFSAGVDREFNRMLSTVVPIAVVAISFALLNLLVVLVFQVDSFRMLLSHAFDTLFAHISDGFLRGFCFVLLSSLLWFFGIHGSDTLEGVMQTCFVPGLAANQAAVAAGSAPETVLTKEFFDCFVLMGGCGAAICLLIAILLFSRNRARRGLGIAAAFPMVFNINELMVFGLPIILNANMLIPFLAAPLVCYSVAYAAVSSGAVPMITHEVAWTTPILLGGYIATGSLAGTVLQLVNVLLGILIYLPFVRLLDRESEENAQERYEEFVQFFRTHEQELVKNHLIDRGDIYGDIARELCADLRHGLDTELTLAYQPQYHYDGRCVGAEALLRWRHGLYGLLFPPLVVKLAEEGGFLPELEEAVLRRALEDYPAVLARFGEEVKLSVNVTGTTVVTPRFLQYCRQLNESDPFERKHICLEVTEQAALSFTGETLSTLRELRSMGLMLAIDDFSMGQTSLNYLKDSLFDVIKLDGSLVKGLFVHDNIQEIISSIAKLANSLDLVVLAEFVETEREREFLHQVGCDCYQGYLYSPAVFLDEPPRKAGAA
jgi:lactose/cellobiose-specific phosphotransferase system IIC component